MEFPLSGSLFEECLHRAGEADGHDDLIGVDVLQSLGCDVLRCPFCKKPVLHGKYDTVMLQYRLVREQKGMCAVLYNAHLAELVTHGQWTKCEMSYFLKSLLPPGFSISQALSLPSCPTHQLTPLTSTPPKTSSLQLTLKTVNLGKKCPIWEI